MTYFKKFTDFCAGIAAFIASLFFIREYMAFDPPNVEEDAPKKIEQLLDPANGEELSMILPLIAVLVLSIIVGRVFQRLPYVCLSISILPLLCVIYMFNVGLLHEFEAFYIILTALHVLGNLVDCLMRDKEDGRHRLSVAAKVSSGFGALFCLYITKLADKQIPTDPKDRLLHFEENVILNMRPLDMKLITNLGWIFLGLLVISLILYNVYFIDAILSVVPLVYSIHAMYSGNLAVLPAVFIALCAVCTTAHLLLCVFENNLSFKEQKRLREAADKEKTA